jgi:HAD superfamily hydrolase (TIGR01509 family)
VTKGGAQAVVLDMDGLMIDTEAVYKRATQQAAAELDHPMSEEFYMTLVGLTNVATEAAVIEHFGDAFPMDAFRERWNSLWKEELATDGVETKPGLDELLEFLESRHVPKAVATSSDRYYTQASLRAARLDRRFDHVVTVDQVTHGKPAPDLYLEAARRLGVSPARCVALEDSDVGVLSATAAGLTTIMVPDLRPPSAEARRAALHVVPTLHEARGLLAALLTS